MSKAENKQFEFNIPIEDQEIPKVSYETEEVVCFPELYEGTGATREVTGIELDANGDTINSFFYIDTRIDPERPVTLEWIWQRRDANDDTVDYEVTITCREMGSAGSAWTIENMTAIELNACTNIKYESYSYELASSDVHANSNYWCHLEQKENGDTLRFNNFRVRYYTKRVQ